jgi:GNAT superfamily N-acetyltransferase
MSKGSSQSIEIVPATADRWDDFEKLFGPSGGYSNCWCTWWMLPYKQWSALSGGDRREVIADLIRTDVEPGLLAYRDGEPVGWCAVGPRPRYARMMSRRAPLHGPPDDLEGGWVVNCFFIARDARRQRVASALLRAAVDFAFERGATAIDGYPHSDTSHGAANLFVGTLSMFELAGFQELTRVNDRPVMRISRPRRRSRGSSRR